MKSQLAALFTSLLLSQTTLANHLQAKPERCPSITAIKATGVSMATKLGLGEAWVAVEPHHQYDTIDTWDFVAISDILANDESDALQQYNKALYQIEIMDGPEATHYIEEDKWACFYASSEETPNTVGIAATPPESSEDKLRGFLKRNLSSIKNATYNATFLKQTHSNR